MSIPGQILFIYIADYIHMSKSTIGPAFVLSYLLVSLLQVSPLIYRFSIDNVISLLEIAFPDHEQGYTDKILRKFAIYIHTKGCRKLDIASGHLISRISFTHNQQIN